MSLDYSDIRGVITQGGGIVTTGHISGVYVPSGTGTLVVILKKRSERFGTFSAGGPQKVN